MVMPNVRKPLWTPAKKQEFLNMVREGVSKARAAKAVGSTWQGCRSAMRHDDEFAEQVISLIEVMNDDVEQALFDSARKGNVEAQKFWLTNRAREEWQHRTHQVHVGSSGGPIEIALGATETLAALLTREDTRGAALGYIDAELSTPGARGALEAHRLPDERGRGSEPRGLEADLASPDPEPADRLGTD
jgi:hypothetical protein